MDARGLSPVAPYGSSATAAVTVGAAGSASCLDHLVHHRSATSEEDCTHMLPPLPRRHNRRVGEQRWEDFDFAIDVGAAARVRVRDGAITNPSAQCWRGNLLVLVRAMRSPEVQPPCADVWHSHVLLTRITHHDVRRATLHGAACLADLTAMMHRSAGAPFKRAVEQARRCAQSGLPSSVGFGAEDPRFAQLGNALHVSANGIKPQLHLDCASIGSWRSMSLQRLVPSGVPVQLSWKGAPDETDRNWLLFEHDGKPRVLFSVEPHVVLTLRANGGCELEHQTSNAVFERRFGGLALHGGVNPVLLTSASGVAFYFVGIFHTKDAKLSYRNYVYTFEARPPFGVLSIGRRPMRLRGERVRFASSLTVLGRPASDEPLLGVSYGVDDSAARFAALPLSVLLADQQDVTGQRVANSSTTFAPFRLWLAHEVPLGKRSPSRDGFERVGRVSDGFGPCVLQHGVRFDAPSIHVAAAEHAEDCCQICLQTAYCHYFTWSASDKVCWLKQWAGTAAVTPGAVSGHFSRRAACGCETASNAGLRAPTVEVRPALSAAECCSSCVGLAGCGGWTWDAARGGRCVLKAPPVDGPAALHKVAGQRSGLVALKPGVLFVHHHPPHLHLGSDRRLLALLEQMVRGGYRPSFAGVDDYDPGPVRGRTRLSELGVPLLAPIVTGEDLLDWVRHHDVAVVVLLLWFWKKASVPALYLRKLRTQLPHVKIVVMSDDVHFRRFMLRDEHEGGPVRGAGREQSADALKEEELRHYYHADHVLAISDFDIREIRAAGKHMDAARFTTLRHVHDEPVLFPLRAALPFASRRGVLFVGNVNNPTNLHGLRWFVTAVMPLLRRVEPNLRLTVAGSWDGEEARGSELHQLLRASGCVDVLGSAAPPPAARVHARSPSPSHPLHPILPSATCSASPTDTLRTCATCCSARAFSSCPSSGRPASSRNRLLRMSTAFPPSLPSPPRSTPRPRRWVPTASRACGATAQAHSRRSASLPLLRQLRPSRRRHCIYIITSPRGMNCATMLLASPAPEVGAECAQVGFSATSRRFSAKWRLAHAKLEFN